MSKCADCVRFAQLVMQGTQTQKLWVRIPRLTINFKILSEFVLISFIWKDERKTFKKTACRKDNC